MVAVQRIGKDLGAGRRWRASERDKMSIDINEAFLCTSSVGVSFERFKKEFGRLTYLASIVPTAAAIGFLTLSKALLRLGARV